MMFGLLLVLAQLAAHGQASPPKQQFVLEISAAASKVKLGSPVVVTVKFTNNSDSTVDSSGAWSNLTRVDPNWRFGIRSIFGESIRRRHYEHEELAGGHIWNRSVAPGKTLTENVDLARLYGFRKPGKYVIQVGRDIPKELGGRTIKSNTITVTLTKD